LHGDGIHRHEKNNAHTLDGAHLNWMDGPSFFASNPVKSLRLAASSTFFGEPMYYHTDAADSRKRKITGPLRRSLLSDVQIAELRITLGAVDPQEWRGMTPASLMELAIDAALAHDAEATLQEAARLRQQEHVRTTPRASS